MRPGLALEIAAARGVAALSRRLGEEVPVRMHDERFTTRIARRHGAGAKADEDSRAAAHLLEDWLAAGPR